MVILELKGSKLQAPNSNLCDEPENEDRAILEVRCSFLAHGCFMFFKSSTENETVILLPIMWMVV